MVRDTRRFLIFVLLLIPTLLFSQGTDETSAATRYESYAGTKESTLSIVASTSWVGAIAKAAGATEVLVLAPTELRHPPEYDFTPQDIMRATKADLVLWAGYEGFIRQLVEAANIDEHRVTLVQTNNAPDQLAASVESLATLLNTKESYTLWKIRLDNLVGQMMQSEDIKAVRTAVAFHHQALARYLGYDVVAVFGPQELTLEDVRTIEDLDVDLIIDNWHNPLGEPFQNKDRQYVQLINFPGPFDTDSILDVLAYNAEQLDLLPAK